jgi:squalene-associated FAD-dependent desaturase
MAGNAGAEPVVVVGGGWAGLAAAVELTHHGVPVILIEAARQLGGRARCVRFDDLRVDNGQHLLVGAYQATLKLIERLGLQESDVLFRMPLSLRMDSLNGRGLEFRVPRLPRPLHLLAGLATAPGLSLAERWAAAALGRAVEREILTVDQDMSVQAWLMGHRQPVSLVGRLWEPLCLATLNTPLRQASARLFLQVLQGTFKGPPQCSDLLIPRTDLGSAIPAPSLDFIERHGGQVRLNQRVLGLDIQNGRVQGVRLRTECLPARQLVLAVDPVMCQRLLASHEALQPIAGQLQQLGTEPTSTVYLRYPRSVALDRPLRGLVGATSQWLFDRRVAGQPGLMAAVISAGGPHMGLSNRDLAQRVARELARLRPRWPAPLASLVIREKRATFAARVGVDRLRPDQRTSIDGLWLAGDFTQTELPATLEGAVRSGQHCATQILQAGVQRG